MNKVLKRLKALWPDCIVVRGRPRHPQTQGSVERGNQDVNSILGGWMKKKNTSKWSIGLYAVAMEKNARYHRTLGASPYELLYGQVPRVKMADLPFDLALAANLTTEAELEDLLGIQNYLALRSAFRYMWVKILSS